MSLAVKKEHVLTISTDMWVPVEDSSPSPSSESKSKIRTEVAMKQLENCKFSNPKLALNLTHAKKESAINSAKTIRTQCSRNGQHLKNGVTSNKYNNMIFHVQSHN